MLSCKTAYSCISDSILSCLSFFRTGEYNRELLEGPEREFDVSKIIIHPGYNPYSLNNDIALIKLKAPIMMDRYRTPVCLPTKPPKFGATCYITGRLVSFYSRPIKVTWHNKKISIPYISLNFDD